MVADFVVVFKLMTLHSASGGLPSLCHVLLARSGAACVWSHQGQRQRDTDTGPQAPPPWISSNPYLDPLSGSMPQGC